MVRAFHRWGVASSGRNDSRAPPLSVASGDRHRVALCLTGSGDSKVGAWRLHMSDCRSGDTQRGVRIVRVGNLLVGLLVALYFLIIPGVLVLRDLRDPALSGSGIPRMAWRVHRQMTTRYERWARERVASGRAAHLETHDVPSTEWPMFGSVYYLWATEALQDAWERDPSLAPVAPAVYARPTVDAALDLILDPVHHTWVRRHWGDNYLHTENVFFRSLLIAGITSHMRLTGTTNHVPLLRDQVESLAADLDASPCGLLNDYPAECYPIDVFAATYVIRKADRVLGTDHSAFVGRELRAFQGDRLDSYGLIPYSSVAASGFVLHPSRGICNSYICIFAPELYPTQAARWYATYVDHFWQQRLGAEGFREFRRDIPDTEWTYDVDSGPVIAGFSPAANAYGVAAARANGRFDHAYTLSAQVLVACWPLADGTLLGARLLSSAAHAPYLGESNLLFLLTRQPVAGVPKVNGGHWPVLVYVWLMFYFGLGSLVVYSTVSGFRIGRGRDYRASALQFGAWLILCGVGAGLAMAGHPVIGFLALLVSQFLPRWSCSRAAAS